MQGQFVLLFALIITGYICRKIKIANDAMYSGLNRFIIYVAYPCLILRRTAILDMSREAFMNFLLTFCCCMISFGIFAVYAYFYAKVRKFPKEDSPVAEFSFISPNNGFMGLPIALTFFGDMALLYMVACNLALNVVFFSYGIALMERGRGAMPAKLGKRVKDIVSLVINPKILAAVIGVLLAYFRIPLPGLVDDYLSAIGAVATPMAMIFIGSTLAGSDLRNVVRSRLVVESSVNRLLVIPLLTLLAVLPLPLDGLVKSVLVLSHAMPIATTVPIFSEQYGKNKALAVESLFLSTVLSMASIPAFIKFITLVF
jgi:predicted permease